MHLIFMYKKLMWLAALIAFAFSTIAQDNKETNLPKQFVKNMA